MEMPTRLESERLIARKYEEGDGRELFAMVERNGNREHLSENAENVSRLATETDAEIMARGHSADWVGRNRFVMGVWLKGDEKYVGEIWIEPDRWDVPSFHIGWLVDGGYEGQGIATEAARRCPAFLFDDLKAHRVSAITRDTNPRSRKVAGRLGFRQEGHLREFRIDKGERYGVLHYGMLKTKFSGG